MLWRYNRRKNNSNPTIIQHTPADCWFSVMLFNPIRWGAQTITPLTLLKQHRLWNSNPLSIGYIHIMWACLWFQVQFCQPDVLIPKMDAPFRGNDKKRLKRSFTTGISCFPHFSLQPDWQLAEVRLFCWLLSPSTHIHLWPRRQLIKPACSEKGCVLGCIAARTCLLVQQFNVIILEVSASRALNSALLFLCLCWFPQQLESCWEVLSLQLDVVYRLSSFQCPQYAGHQAQLFLWELPGPLCVFPPWTWVDSPPPQPPPTWLLRLKIAPAVLQCVLSSPQLLHSLHRWWMRHCFSSQCFSKLLWECI